MTFPEGRLGEPVRTFEGRTGGRGAPVWPALVPPALVSLALIPPAIVYLRDGVWWAGVPALLLSMGCAAAAGWIAGRDRPRTGAKVVHLYTNGISVAGPDGVAAYEWDDLVSVTVAGVQEGGPDGRTRWRFTVVAEDGNVLHLTDDLPDVRELGETVAREVTARLVPRRLAEVKAGELVRLDPFTVDLDGVEKDGERLPWAAVKDVSIDNGLVTVHAWGGRPDLVAVVSQMPDALAFAALCHRVKDLTEPP
ncbi:hypothetical protein FHX41_0916 [Actinomadura hallensis]|uniref:Uncharacterized protein n=1 Tax=Actinomadura hallensis TaxID=337895 RepID=A0A543I9R8_9ACTN|nr:DUF6585 family protein [Actinomadura hallensis]TQM67311.1 hypothetical protein FHX41_0916 [Actinomadura hallensis]